MKIFALYFRINVWGKPEWFNDFRKKYDEEYDFDVHVTLIQPRYIDEQSIEVLQQKLSAFLDAHTLREEDRAIEFNELVYGLEEDGTYLFMLRAPLKEKLVAFQKELRETLRGFGRYVEETHEEYEVNFKPHITIARDIKENELEEVKSYFETDHTIAGTITELVLPIVKDMSLEEANDPKNLAVLDF